jgi:hypothetical protein
MKPGPEGGRWVFLYPQVYTGITYGIAALFLLELRRQKVGLWAWERHAVVRKMDEKNGEEGAGVGQRQETESAHTVEGAK